MSFVAGLIVGCVVGVLASLLFILVVNAVPEGAPHGRRQILPGWQFTALIMATMLAATLAYQHLNLHRMSFMLLLLLFLVFITAKSRGLLQALIALAFSAILMSYTLPPPGTIRIASVRDQVLLLVFVIFGVVISRLLRRRQEGL